MRKREREREKEGKKKTPLQIRRLMLMLMYDVREIELNEVNDKIARDVQLLSIYTDVCETKAQRLTDITILMVASSLLQKEEEDIDRMTDDCAP